MSDQAVPPMNQVTDSPNGKRRIENGNSNNTSTQNLNPHKRSHNETNGNGEHTMSDHTTLDSASVSHHPHQHHHPPSIALPPLEGTFDAESMKALSTPSRSFHNGSASAATADNTPVDDDLGFPEVSEQPDLARHGSNSSWDESNGLGDFMVPDSSKVPSIKHAGIASIPSVDIGAPSTDTLHDMAKQLANPVSSGEKVDFSLTSDSNMLNFSESQSARYTQMAANNSSSSGAAAAAAPAPVKQPAVATAAIAAVGSTDLMDIAMSSASLDLFDLDLLDIDNLNKLPAVPGAHTNLSNVFSSSANRMPTDNDSNRSSSIGSNTIISWNEDVPDPSNQTDMDLMLGGIATGKFSESPQSAFVNTGAGGGLNNNSSSSHNMNNRSNNSMTRNKDRDVRAKTFVRHNNSNNSSTSNISVESNRSGGSKVKRFSTKQPQDSRQHINNHYKDPFFQPTPNIFNESYDQLNGTSGGGGATLTASNLQQNQQNYSFPTTYAPVHHHSNNNYRDQHEVRSNNSNNSRPNSVRSAKTVSPVSDPGAMNAMNPNQLPQPKSPTEGLSPALQLQMQAMHLQQQTQPVFQATMPIFATEALQQQYQLLQQQQIAQQQQLLLQQQQQQQALIQQQQRIQQQLAMGLIDPNSLLVNGGRGVSPANVAVPPPNINNASSNRNSNNSTSDVIYTFPTATLPDPNRGRALSDTSSVQSSVTNSNRSLSALRPEKAKRDHSNTSNSNRGNYRCGRCGQPKVNHVCEYIDTSMVSVETQTFMPIVADFRSMTLLSADKIVTVIARRTIDEDYCQPATKRTTPTMGLSSSRRNSATPAGGTPGTPVLGDLQSRSNSSTELVSSRPNSGVFNGSIVSPNNGTASRNNSGTFEYPVSVIDMNGNMQQYFHHQAPHQPPHLMQPQMMHQPQHLQQQQQYYNHQQQQQQQQQLPQTGQYSFPMTYAPHASPAGPYGGQQVYHQISNSYSAGGPYQPQQQLDNDLAVMNENEADMLMELMDTFDESPLTPQPPSMTMNNKQVSDDLPNLGSAVSSMSNSSSIESGRTSNSTTINLGNTMHRSVADQSTNNFAGKAPFNFSMMCSSEKSTGDAGSGGTSEKACTPFFCGSL